MPVSLPPTPDYPLRKEYARWYQGPCRLPDPTAQTSKSRKAGGDNKKSQSMPLLRGSHLLHSLCPVPSPAMCNRLRISHLISRMSARSKCQARTSRRKHLVSLRPLSCPCAETCSPVPDGTTRFENVQAVEQGRSLASALVLPLIGSVIPMFAGADFPQ
jgi:hypothetical protein